MPDALEEISGKTGSEDLVLETFGPRCRHSGTGAPEGLALVTVGNELRGDDGIAGALCDLLGEDVLAGVCRYDLGPYSGHLLDCASGHEALLIVDATANGTGCGEVTVCDMRKVLEQSPGFKIRSSHGLSIADELLLPLSERRLPSRIIFFGIEAESVDFKNGLSDSLKEKLPGLACRLSALVRELKLRKEEAGA